MSIPWSSEFVSKSLDAIVVIDIEGTVCEWSPEAERLLGWRSDDAIGKTLASLVVPEQDRQAHWKGLKDYPSTLDGRLIDGELSSKLFT